MPRFTIDIEAYPREGEDLESLAHRIDCLVTYGSLRDAFDAADIDVESIGRAELR